VIRVYDFRCAQGHVTEMFVDSDLLVTNCPRCGDLADRTIPAPRSQLEGFSGAFPGAYHKWAANRESHMAKERKSMASKGEYLNGRPVKD
jgi:hypothetical protein